MKKSYVGWVIIPVHNRREKTRCCLERLVEQSHGRIGILVVDDGSSDGTYDMVREGFGEANGVWVIRGDGTLYWGGAVELGMRWVSSNGGESWRFILTINNDVVPCDGYLDYVLEAASVRKGCVVGSVSYDPASGMCAIGGWRILAWPLALTQRVWCWVSVDMLRNAGPEFKDVDYVPGTGMVVPREVVEGIGFVDSKRFRHYQADSEYSYRAKKNGFSVLLYNRMIVAHDLRSTGVGGSDKVSVSFKDIMASFLSVRSPNFIPARFWFGIKCCPWYWWPFYFCFDFIKVIVRMLALWVGGGLAERLKRISNFST